MPKETSALCGGLRRIGWNVPDSQGTMFVWAKIPKGYASSFEFLYAACGERPVFWSHREVRLAVQAKGYVRMALVADLSGDRRNSGSA